MKTKTAESDTESETSYWKVLYETRSNLTSILTLHKIINKQSQIFIHHILKFIGINSTPNIGKLWKIV